MLKKEKMALVLITYSNVPVSRLKCMFDDIFLTFNF